MNVKVFDGHKLLFHYMSKKTNSFLTKITSRDLLCNIYTEEKIILAKATKIIEYKKKYAYNGIYRL